MAKYINEIDTIKDIIGWDDWNRLDPVIKKILYALCGRIDALYRELENLETRCSPNRRDY